MQQNEFVSLSLDQIIDPKVLLRFVNKKNVAYLELLDSIQKKGLLNSICVRPAGDRAPGKYEVIDGFYRLTCCREIGMEPVPAIVRYGLTDEEVLAEQIQANALRPETTTIEYARQLKRLQKAFPGITLPELAAMVGKKPGWISNQLGLLELAPRVQKMVDRGDIPTQSAYMLAKVPSSFQGGLIDAAKVMPTKEFAALAAAVIKRFMEQVRQGKLDKRYNDLPFEPQPYLRSLREVLAEIDSMRSAANVIVTAGAKTAIEGFKLGLLWAAHLDSHSVQAQRDVAEGKAKANLRRLYEERLKDEDLNNTDEE